MNQDNRTNKSVILVLIASLATFIVYSAVIFSICGFRDHQAVFWLSYVFMVVCVCVVSVSLILANQKTIQPRDRVLSFPIYQHCLIFFTAELLVSILFIILDKVGIPWGIPFSIQLVMLAIHIAFAVSCFYSKEVITNLQDKVRTNTTMMKMLCADAELLAEKISDPDTKKQATALAEAIRYSDNVSNEILQPMEAQIGQYITMAGMCADEKRFDEVKQCCVKAEALLRERNKKCSILK